MPLAGALNLAEMTWFSYVSVEEKPSVIINTRVGDDLPRVRMQQFKITARELNNKPTARIRKQ